MFKHLFAAWGSISLWDTIQQCNGHSEVDEVLTLSPYPFTSKIQCEEQYLTWKVEYEGKVKKGHGTCSIRLAVIS